MGAKERRERHKVKLRESILKAAEKIAAKGGWDDVTMRRIADEIEYTLPVIYTYFKSKEEIISNIADRGFAQLQIELEEVYTKFQKDTKQLIAEMFLTYVHFSQTKKAFYQAMYGLTGVSSFTEGDPQEGSKLFNYVYDIVNGITSDKKAKINNPWKETKFVWATLHGLITLDYINRVEDKDNNLESLTIDLAEDVIARWGIK
ncbi:MAG: TetR/AcrR family transcriptional regulator [bacterium]